MMYDTDSSEEVFQFKNQTQSRPDPTLAFLKQAAAVKPQKKVLDWFNMEFYAFIHFGPNTFTNREWGTGKESPEIFNPTKLDCNQWAETLKTAGMKGMVLTCKHHDGFCLWPSKYTEHSVKNSPLQRDVVREAAEACRRAGLKFGIYLSPWDMNSPLYGTLEYNDYFCAQLTELLTEYGEIFYVWFDNACGEGPNGRRQEYDFPRYFELIRKYQPNALIFNDYGPDIRWCGNEAGVAREAEWAVVPSELCSYSEVQTGPGPLADAGDLRYLYSTHKNIGEMNMILYSKGLTFTPAEMNMSIRPGWFWHPEEEPHSVERLFTTYLTSVGANSCFHLNIPPTTEGLLDLRDVARLRELRQLLRREFGQSIQAQVRRVPGSTPMQPKFEISVPAGGRPVKYVVLREEIGLGQRIESFQIEGEGPGTEHFPLYQGRTVGNRRICALGDPFADQNPLTRTEATEKVPGERKLYVQVTAAREEVYMKSIEVF